MAQPPNPFEQQKAIPGVRHIITVASGKGGVGKSTVATNLALALVHQGKKVGLLDADIYGPSIPRMLGAINQKLEIDSERMIQPLQRHRLKIMSIGFLIEEGMAVIWRGPMLFKAMDQFFRDVMWGELDYLIIDLPPGTGDVQLSVARKVPVAGGIVVCTPQNIALADAKKAIDMFEKVNVPLLGVVENMSWFQPPGQGERVQLFPKGELNSYLESKKLEKLAEIPFHPNVGMTAEAGIPIVEAQPNSEESKVFLALAEKICKKLP